MKIKEQDNINKSIYYIKVKNIQNYISSITCCYVFLGNHAINNPSGTYQIPTSRETNMFTKVIAYVAIVNNTK